VPVKWDGRGGAGDYEEIARPTTEFSKGSDDATAQHCSSVFILMQKRLGLFYMQ